MYVVNGAVEFPCKPETVFFGMQLIFGTNGFKHPT